MTGTKKSANFGRKWNSPPFCKLKGTSFDHPILKRRNITQPQPGKYQLDDTSCGCLSTHPLQDQKRFSILLLLLLLFFYRLDAMKTYGMLLQMFF